MIGNRCYTQWNTDKGGKDDTQKQSALKMHDGKDTRQNYTDDKQYGRGTCQCLQMIEDSTFSQDATVLKANHGYKEADTYGNSVLQRCRHHLEDDLSQTAHTEEYEE